MTQARLELVSGPQRRLVWGRKDEEYIADFSTVSKRYLDEAEYRIFRFHYLLGADWRLCCRQLKMDKGTFFHAVYRIQQKLGKVYRELQPYSLFPLDEYFGGTMRTQKSLGHLRQVENGSARRRNALVPPLRKVA